ncbi:uncharacterized protein LOC123505700 [Portunus trituberculatus]|uniref:Uncharacterized protein n=1 Tax=Portunus trituberculatus TaxID=210409 RepID=A0A5B7I3G0_PORTR|nr:uncharacterized protein LOC123505700 [Portunus trituberculatus]MPC76803.1 hypothetical protein [Portunus trituberculatus]
MKLTSLLLVLVAVATAAASSIYGYGSHNTGYGSDYGNVGYSYGYGRPQISSIVRLHPARIHVSPFHITRGNLAPSYVHNVRLVRPAAVVVNHGYGYGQGYGYGGNAGYGY